MMRLIRTVAMALLLGALAAAIPAPISCVQAQSGKKFEKPVLVTSSGQALDAFTVKTLLGRAGVNANYDPKATAAALDGAKTVIIAVGVSNKGFGQAGITAESEMARTKAILDTAKSKDIRVIFVHIGGAERRKGLSVQFVELVAPVADQLVVTKDGNVDDYFEKVSKSSDIPLLLIDQSLEVGKALANLMASS
jgi:hypothetical protein